MRSLLRIAVPVCLTCGHSGGEIIEYEDKDQWIEAVSGYATIDFTGFPAGTVITDQYQDLGVVFVNPTGVINGPNDSYPNDGWGLDGHGQIVLSFKSPQNWIGVDSPSDVLIQLFLDGEFVNAGAAHGPGFEGVVSDQPFDAAILLDFDDDLINPDDVFFGAQLPGDANNDGDVNVLDLVAVVLAWGACPTAELCFTDLNHDETVAVDDLVAVVLNWE